MDKKILAGAIIGALGVTAGTAHAGQCETACHIAYYECSGKPDADLAECAIAEMECKAACPPEEENDCPWWLPWCWFS